MNVSTERPEIRIVFDLKSLVSSLKANLEVASAIRSLVNAVTAMQQQLLTHDLTVFGLNPAAGVSFEEQDSLALKKYNDVMASMEEQRELLRKLNLEADLRMKQMRQ